MDFDNSLLAAVNEVRGGLEPPSIPWELNFNFNFQGDALPVKLHHCKSIVSSSLLDKVILNSITQKFLNLDLA